MLFQDSSCVAVVSFRDFKKKGLYEVLHADACAILAVSHRYRKVKIEGIDAWNDMEPQFCQTLCQTYREEIWAAEGAQNLFDEASGTSMVVIHLHTQQRFKAFVIFFRRSQPFPPSELSWAKRFMDLYYEKVLLFNDLYQANEYINHIFEGAEFPILIFDNNGELISLNLFACDIFHLEQPKEFRRYQAGNDSFFAMLRQVAATNRKRHADGMAFAMEGGVLRLNLSMSPIHNTKGVVVGVSVLCSAASNTGVPPTPPGLQTPFSSQPRPILPDPPASPQKIYLRAFGRFDMFADNQLVSISSAKAKELLALCVDHCGGDVTMEEAIDKLWADRAYDERSKNLYRKTVSYLHHLFETLNRQDVFSSARGRCHLNREAVDCDYFRYLSGDYVPFTGEYLSNYSWAEETTAWLAWQQSKRAEPAPSQTLNRGDHTDG